MIGLIFLEKKMSVVCKEENKACTIMYEHRFFDGVSHDVCEVCLLHEVWVRGKESNTYLQEKEVGLFELSYYM